MKWFGILGAIGCAMLGPAWGQSWNIPHRTQQILLDGWLEDWRGVPELILRPGASGVRTQGEFGDSDVSVKIKALWDEDGLYLAVEWQDDRWDIREVRRRDAVFVTPDRRRRDRMLFFDNLKFQIRTLEFDYLLWVSPRVQDQGPFFWHRRLRGANVRESATRDPVITPREHEDGRVTLEILLEWKELELKPKKLVKNGLPVLILLADSDQPGSILESKLANLKSLEWDGTGRLAKR